LVLKPPQPMVIHDSISGGGRGGVAHSTPTNQKPSNAPIFVHSSTGHAAAVAAAAAAAANFLPRAAGVATKTPAVTAMAGAQTTITNQLKTVTARAMETATMRVTTTNENKGDSGGSGDSGSLAAARRWWWWQRGVGGSGSAAAATAARQRWRRQFSGGGSSSAAAAVRRWWRR
jgi:hypothetical protein